MRRMLKSKLHRAVVTEADKNYEGSITIDEDLMDASDFIEYETVLVANVTNGNRLETYVMKGERGSGVICMNGAAAHLCTEGDIIIVFSFTTLDDESARAHKPIRVMVGDKNTVKEIL